MKKVIKLSAFILLFLFSLFFFSCGGAGGDGEEVSSGCQDNDKDGYGKNCAPGDDCDDTNNAIYPNAPEICDTIDNQCPGDAGYGSIDDDCGWSATFGGSNNEVAYSVKQTQDEGYVVTGYTDSFSTGESDIWVIKLDENGNKLWDKTFGGPEPDMAFSILEIEEGYILSGFTESYGEGKRDVWVLALDPSGNKTWDKTYGGVNEDVGYEIKKTQDAGYVVGGWTYSYGNGASDFWILKLDSKGEKKWDKALGGTSSDWAYSIEQTKDGGYIALGFGWSYGAGATDLWVVKLDSKGNKLWDKAFGGSECDHGYSVKQTKDEGYILGGTTYNTELGLAGMWLIKLDKNGNKNWDQIYGYSIRAPLNRAESSCVGSCIIAYSVKETKDGGYVSAGTSGCVSDFLVLKTDANGDKIWDKKFAKGTSADNEVAYSIEQTKDDGYIVAGSITLKQTNKSDVLIFKLDKDGNCTNPRCF